MATSGTSTQPAPRKKKKGSLLTIMLVTPVALVLLPSTLVLIPAMVPTIVARIVDPGPGRHLTVTVGSLNLAGSLWFLRDLWYSGQHLADVMPTLSDTIGWLAALLGAGCGWTIYWIMPSIMRNIATTKSNLRLAKLRRQQEDLVEQWGPPVREGADFPPA